MEVRVNSFTQHYVEFASITDHNTKCEKHYWKKEEHIKLSIIKNIDEKSEL